MSLAQTVFNNPLNAAFNTPEKGWFLNRFKEKVNYKYDEDIWEYAPVKISEFFKSPYYLNLGGIVYEQHLKDLDLLFNPKDPLRPKYNYVFLVEAIGSGKSMVWMSGLMCYGAYLLLCMKNPQKYFGLKPMSELRVMNAAVSAVKAKIVYNELISMVTASPWFQEHYQYDKRLKSELRFDTPPQNPDIAAKKIAEGTIYKNIFITPGSSTSKKFIGFHIFYGFIDEANAFRIAVGPTAAQTIFDEIDQRIESRFRSQKPKTGLLVAGCSPQVKIDFLEQKIEESNSGKFDALILRRPIWFFKKEYQVNEYFYVHLRNFTIHDKPPKGIEYQYRSDQKVIDCDYIKVPIPLKHFFESNVLAALRNQAAIPGEVIYPFLEDPRIITANANHNRKAAIDPITGKLSEDFKPISKLYHAVHIDLAITGEKGNAALSMGHWEFNKKKSEWNIYIDLMVAITPKQGERIKISSIRKFVISLRDKYGFNIGIVTYDRFESEESRQELLVAGLSSELLSIDRNPECYTDLYEYLVNKRLDYYHYSVFERELRTLERDDRTGKIQKLYADSPRMAEKYQITKDVSDCVAGVTHKLIVNANEHNWKTISDRKSEVLIM